MFGVKNRERGKGKEFKGDTIKQQVNLVSNLEQAYILIKVSLVQKV